MTKRQFVSLVVMVAGTILATGVTAVAARGLDGNFSRPSFSKVASPGDGASKEKTSEKKKDKDTESTTEVSTAVQPSQPLLDSAELSAITKEYNDTLQEKTALQEKLNLLLENQNDFITRLHEMDDMIIEYQEKIDEIQEKTDRAQQTMDTLQQEIEFAQLQQDAQYTRLKEHIRQEYENGTYTYLDALFNAVDYNDIVNKTEYIQAVDTYNNNILGQITSEKRKLEDKKAMLTMVTEDMGMLQEMYITKQESMETLSKEKEEQIGIFQASIDAAKSEMATIEALEAEQTAKLAQIESQYNLSISLTGPGMAVEYNGAEFLWPMPSSTSISSYYGPRIAPTAGATSYHRGIDIGCPMGSPVIAVAPGKVIYVGYLGTAGNAVIVDHGSGISSCYFHLSAFAVEVGDEVSAGQTICLSGNTGVSTGPHLHFAIRENGEYVNPLKYYKNVQDKSTVKNTEGGEE